jgi:L-threonylcarbamoyladenylate synthase
MATINTVPEVIRALMNSEVAVVPTDTLYGIVARAMDKKAVEKLYKVKARDKKKPCIVLITEIEELKDFGVKLSEEQEEFLNRYGREQLA